MKLILYFSRDHTSLKDEFIISKDSDAGLFANLNLLIQKTGYSLYH